MPTPTVPKRANQIPRSLPNGVGGGDGFGHHPKPISGDMSPADFPMKQRRYRGAAGGQWQWDSKTETPVWREIPGSKTQVARKQYNPSPRERFPNTYKKSRYKPGLMRTPTRNSTLPKPTASQWKEFNKIPAKKINGDLRSAAWEVIKHQFRVDPTSVSDSRKIPYKPYIPPDWVPPKGPAGEEGRFKCSRGLSDQQAQELFGKFSVPKDQRYRLAVRIYEIRDELGNFICTEEIPCLDDDALGFKFMTPGPYWVHPNNEASRIPKYHRWQIGGSWEVKGYGSLSAGDYDNSLKTLAIAYGEFVYNYQEIPSIGMRWRSNVSKYLTSYRINSGTRPDTGEKYGIGITGGGGGYGIGLNFSDNAPSDKNLWAKDVVDSFFAERDNKTRSIGPVHVCTLYPSEEQLDLDPIEPDDDDYDFDVDEDTPMGCKWQKDEVSYTLPELKIGSSKVGGNSISIDDGLIPLADFVCKSLELMHKGLGLHELDDTEFDKVLGDSSKGKIKPASLGELVHWQFENVSSLVGLPSAQEIVTIDNEKKDFAFRNVQDALTFLYHQQRESDMDLKIIETYNVKTAQQLEAVTQIALRQTADLEMIIQELGIKWKWERKERPSLYKHGMSDEDEKTGILELFKGGTVAYPVRVWADEVDSKQVALKTNLYAEMAAQSTLTRINSSEGIPGLDARVKMKSGDDESWKEWVKAINIPEKGTVSGVATPYIEEYDKGTLEAKNIGAPTSALSVFMKPKKAPKK